MNDTSHHVVPFQVAARELGLSAATLRRICKDGRGPTLLRLSLRRLGIRRGDLDAWVASRVLAPESGRGGGVGSQGQKG